MNTYLHAITVSGKTFDVNETDGNFELMVSANDIEVGYDNITSIANWHYVAVDSDGNLRSEEKILKDYKWVRDQIKNLIQDNAISNTLSEESDPSTLSPTTGDTYLVATEAVLEFSGHTGEIAEWDGSEYVFWSTTDKGFDMASAMEKVCLAEHKIGSHALRVAAVGFANAVNLGLQYNGRVVPVRQKRLAIAHGLVHNYLPNDAKKIFDGEIWGDVEKITMRYVFFGIEGTIIGDPEGMYDWLFGLNSFVGKGLVDKAWTPEAGLTMFQLAGAAWSVIHDGNY